MGHPAEQTNIDAAAPDTSTAELTAELTAAEALNELRTLILGGAPADVLNPKLTPEELSQILPAAMSHAHQKNAEITIAALPTVENAIQSSVQQNATVLAEALFPVIGPATRKSITAAIGTLIQSLNQTLEHSLSPQSFKWRIEARRTGKTFAEVVLIRTLVYQVEQVFLIHKETGLVIQHIVTDTTTAQDPDLVAAMLTAIQDFVQDSFKVDGDKSIDTLKLGDFTLLIEDGPQAVLAAVVRGTPPQEIRTTLRTQLERIHLLFGPALHSFNGDQSKLEGTQPYLQDCFQSKFKGARKKKKRVKRPPLSKPAKLLIGCLAGLFLTGLGTWAFLNWQSNRHWQQFIGSLEQQPGFVVINQYKRHGKYHLQGLRDPMAGDPQQLLAAANVQTNQVEINWNPYLSLEPEFLSRRTQALLAPPSTVSLTLDDQGVLQASGRASEDWIQWAKQTSAQLEGINGWHDSDLISIEREQLRELCRRIEYRRFAFVPGKAELRGQGLSAETSRYSETLNNQAQDIKNFLQLAQRLDQPVTIVIKGHGDQRGNSTQTLRLGETRASALRQYLINQGVSADRLSAEGVAIDPGTLTSDRRANDLDDEAAAYLEVQF